MTKDLIEAIEERRSIRSYKGDPIPDPTIGRILECGRWAPSAGNIEPWFFYVVKNKDVIKKLAELSEPWLKTAPVVIVVVGDYHEEIQKYGNRGKDLYLIQDTAAATQNMLLAAHGFGLGSCWVGNFNPYEVKKLLNIPEGQMPLVLITLGYPDEEPQKHIPRKPLDQIVNIIH